MRLIGPNGEQLGVLPTQRALAHAQDLGYDLVEIAPNVTPPVARILDFGKYRFAEQQKLKEAKKRQKSVTWKEIRVSPKIDEHDIDTKVKSASKFLAEGDKLKVTVRFRGRELAHPDRGRALLLSIADRLKEHGSIERQPILEGRSMFLVMNPLRGLGATPAPAPAAPAPAAAPRPAAAAPTPAAGTRPAPGLPRIGATAPARPATTPPAAPRPAAPPSSTTAPRPAAPRTTPTKPPTRSN